MRDRLLPAFTLLLGLLTTAAAPGGQPEAQTLRESAAGAPAARAGQVAYPIPEGTAVEARPRLTVLSGGLPEAMVARLKEEAPNLEIINGLNRQTALEHAARAHAIDTRLLSPELLAAAPNLVWVHALSAGVDRFVSIEPLRENDRILLTNSRAAHGPAIADHVMAMLLSLTRNLPFYEAAQRAGRWSREEPPTRSIALQDRTMLVVGLGGIGAEVAQRAHAFGMKIIATRRTDAPSPDFIARTGRPQDLPALLPEADVVVICVPLTPETQGLFNAAAFEAMKPGAILINIARGKVVETDALLAALKSGRLAGAGLDVTDPEPLPEGHALWTTPNVLITPHIAADAQLTEDRVLALYEDNLRRFAAGQPLQNLVDKHAGY